MRKAMCVQRDMLASGKECWLATLEPTLKSNVLGSEYWMKCWDSPNFEVQCYNVSIDSQGKRVVTEWADELKESFIASAQGD